MWEGSGKIIEKKKVTWYEDSDSSPQIEMVHPLPKKIPDEISKFQR